MKTKKELYQTCKGLSRSATGQDRLAPNKGKKMGRVNRSQQFVKVPQKPYRDTTHDIVVLI